MKPSSLSSHKPAAPQIPLVLALLGGALFAAMGTLIYATVLGKMPGKVPTADMPVTILWLAGTVFFCAGIGIAAYRFLPRLAGLCALISLASFVAIFNWIAFGPGERSFTKRSSISSANVGSAKQGAASELEGRLVFGLVAGGLDALILIALYRSVKTRLRPASVNDMPVGRNAGDRNTP